jgi:transposase InsO family protein
LIDVFSNFADVIPMKNKGIDDTTNALKIILETYNLEPITLMSDSDSSFLGSKFQSYLKTKDIELDPVIVNDHRSLGKIDRFARTLKTRITKLFLANGNTNWIDYIADILFSYNNTKNRGILNYTPQQVISDPVAENEVLKLNIEKFQGIGCEGVFQEKNLQIILLGYIH